MDVMRFLTDWDAGDAGARMRLGQARVRSVDTDTSVTISSGQAVIVPASAEWPESAVVASYLGEYPPRPGGSCWYVTDGVDRIILGSVAPEGPPAVSASMSTALATLNNTATGVTNLTTVDFDPWNMTESSGTAIKIPADGMYSLQGYGVWDSNATGFRQLGLILNGTALQVNRIATVANANSAHAVTMNTYPLRKGDLISANARQTSGTAINLAAFTMSVQYVGRRRTAGTGQDVMIEGRFDSGSLNQSGVSKWFTSTPSGGTAVFDISPNTYSTNIRSLKMTCVSGATNRAYLADTIPCIPGQKFQVSVAIKASIAMSNVSNYGIIDMWGAATGPASEDYTWGSNWPGLGTSQVVITTGWSVQTVTGTVPSGVYVMRPMISAFQSSGVNQSVWIGQVTVQEVIS